MLTQKQTSTALFTLCLGTFLALLGCSFMSSFIIAFVIGIILLGISYLKKSLISATTVLDSDSNCAVTVKRTEQKSAIPEPSFLGKASVTPLKNCTPSGVTPNVQEVKQVLNFAKSANSSITTPVKQLNNSVIRLKNAHYGASAWPLNSTPIEKKPALVEQNYHMNMMKAINNVQQASPYSVKRSAVDKECSPPVVSQHKKPKTLPLLKEGRSLRHVPTVYVVHKKAENILKNKGNKRVLENTENVNDSKRRNKEEGEVEKPQKRKLLSIVHITGKKHKVPSINSPTKYSRNTDLVVTNDDLKEDRRRNEERVRKLLAHKDDENTKPSIKPAKEPAASSSNKVEVTKIVTMPPSDKENTAPAPSAAELNAQTPTVETPKSLPKPSSQDAPILTDSRVVKSLFGNSGTSEKDPKPGFTFGSTSVKSEPPPQQTATNPAEVKPTLSFGAVLDKPLNNLSSKGDEQNKSITTLGFGSLTSSVTTSSEGGAAKPTFSFGGSMSSTSSTTPSSISIGGLNTVSNSASSASVPSLTAQNPPASSSAPSFSFGGSSTTTATASQPESQASGTKLPSFAGALAAPAVSSSASETKPAFSFGSAAPSSSSGFSFGAKASSTAPSIGSIATAQPAASAAPSFSFGGSASSVSSQSTLGATDTAASAAGKGFSFGSGNPTTTVSANSIAQSTSAASKGFSFGSATSATTSTAPSTGFSFGGAANATSTSSGGPTSIFGAPNSTAAPTTAPSAGFSFASTSNPAAPPAAPSGFSFGSSSIAGGTPAFGATSTASNSTTGFSFSKSANTAAPSFGATTTTPSTGFSFGGSASTTPAFGGATSTGSAFGAASSTTQAFGAASSTPAFGAASSTTPAFGAASSTTSAFGGSSTTTPAFGAASSNLTAFGAAPATSSNGSVFGSSGSSSTFGSSSTPAFGATSTPGAPAFGASTAGSVFGASTTSTASSSGVFGAPSSSTPAFSFGGQSTSNPTSAAPATGGFNFSSATTSTPTPATGFSFGSAPAAPAAAGFNFGGSSDSTPTGGSPAPANLFSNPATTTARRIATPRRRKPR
ncbi:hypothetical protein ACHWQZ_G009845 [Mnemiopsis leidyi]